MAVPKIYSILPKLLHKTKPNDITSVKTPPSNGIFYNILDTKMDFYFRKVLKYNNIAYSFDRKKRYLTINTPTSPFKFFMIFDDDSNYITIRKIPWDEFEYKINAKSVEHLIKKMVQLNIIYPRHLQVLIVPMAIKAEQEQLIEEIA